MNSRVPDLPSRGRLPAGFACWKTSPHVKRLGFTGAEVTPLEVIDTAVKVGLGAAISGLSAYWMGKSKARDDLRRERLTRHHGLLEKSAEQIESFSHVILRYWALMIEWVRARDQGFVLEPHRAEELAKSKAELFNAFSDLTSA